MIILSCHCMRELKMDSLIMDKKISFAQDFQLNHVLNTTSSSSSIGQEDHDEPFDDDDEDEEEVNSLASPLQDMSCLLQQLPLKRGLSKHYNGKSQSFTSLLNVTSLEDLAKPENPLNKKLKSCKSYGVFPRTNSCSRVIEKRPSAGFALVVNNGARNSNKNCNN